MKISTEMTHTSYEIGIEVYKGSRTLSEGVDFLAKVHGMNSSSARDCIVNIKLMVDGKVYERTNNLEATEYYLRRIAEDFGRDKLKNAISSLGQHITYYENLTGVTSRGNRRILEKYSSFLLNMNESLYPDEIEVSDDLYEGAKKPVMVNSYERNTKAREICIKYYGIKCSVCEINFQNVYGDIGKDFIHVHHLTQLSNVGEKYKIDPVNDLRPVCPNCHSMLHRKNPPYTIEELKLLYKNSL